MRGDERTGHGGRREAAYAAVALMLIVSMLPFVSTAGSDADAYAGESYEVTYTTGDVDVDETYNEDSGQQSVTVTYYGVPYAEFNPQYWAGSFADSSGNTYNDNWYGVENYPRGRESSNLTVFTGWKVSGTDKIVDPGEDLRDLVGDDGRMTLEATWGRAENVDRVMGPKFTFNPSGGSKYTNILYVYGDIRMNGTESIGNCTIVSADSYGRPTSNKVLSGSVILDLDDDVILAAVDLDGSNGNTTQLPNMGVFANGHQLIVGPMVGCDNNVQLYGGSSSGWSNSSMDSTDLRVFGGTYSNIVGGCDDDFTGSVGETSVRILGDDVSVIEAVIGGSINGSVGTTNVLVAAGNINTSSLESNGFGISGKFSVVIGGSRTGEAGTTNVEITGDAKVSAVQGGGRSATSHTDHTNVTVSGRASVELACGGLTDGRPSGEGRIPVGETSVTVTDSARVSQVYGGGWDMWALPHGVSTERTNVLIAGGRVDEVYGGGFRGSVGVVGQETVSVTIVGGVVGDVYGGGRGGADLTYNPSSYDSSTGSRGPGYDDTTGRAYVYGDVRVEVVGGTVTGSVYGGGRGAEKQSWDTQGCTDSAKVVGDVTMLLDSVSVGGSVYGGGLGSEDAGYEDVARVEGSVRISVTGGASIAGDLYGGGCYGALYGGAVPGELEIDISQSEVGGNVHSGGMGEEGRLATDLSNRVVVIEGSDIGGSVYGGSRFGNDNCETAGAGEGMSIVQPHRAAGENHSCIYIVSGDILGGDSGNVYGGGFRGFSNMDTHIFIGAPAADEVTGAVPGGELAVRSVYGGSSVGHSDDGDLDTVLLTGDSEIVIGSEGYGSFRLSGDVFGEGDFCAIGGESSVRFEGFSQNGSMLSVQKADLLEVVDSVLVLDGNMDGSSTDGSPMLSLNIIGHLEMVGEERRSELVLNSAASQISGYRSTYADGDREAGDLNELRINSGMVFSILGDGNSGQGMGVIEGDTLLSSDSNEYYGALVMGARSALRNDPGFWVDTADGIVQAKTADYGYGTVDVRVWYLDGAYKVVETVIFEDSTGTKAEIDETFSVLLPKVRNDSTISYAGHFVNPYAPDSLDLVASQDMAVPGSEVSVRFGMGSGNGSTLFGDDIGGSYEGLDLAEAAGVVPASVNGGAELSFEASVIGGYGTTGYIGKVTVHFVEMNGGLVANIFDVEIGFYLRIVTDSDYLEISEDVVMRGDGPMSGTVEVYLPFLPGNATGTYALTSVSSDGTVSMTTEPTNLNRDGWVESDYREDPLVIEGSSSESILLGTGGVFSPVIRISYSTDGGPAAFEPVILNIELTGGDEPHRITVTLNPEPVTTVEVTFSDKVLDFSQDGKWGLHIDLFTIGIDFGTSVSGHYVAVDRSMWDTSGDATDFVGSIQNSLLYNQGNVVVSTDRTILESQANGYEVMTVEGLLETILESKPDTSYTDGGYSGSFDYSESYPGWYDSLDGYSPFNFGSEVTQSLTVYAGYSVAIGVELRPDSPGSINATVLFPGAPGTTVDLTGRVGVEQGYTIEGWYLLDGDRYVEQEDVSQFRTYSNTTVYVMLEPLEYPLTVSFVDREHEWSLTADGTTVSEHTFTVGQELVISVTDLTGNEHVASVSANGGTWNEFSIAGGHVSFTAPAMGLHVTIDIGTRYAVTVVLTEHGGYDDNELFGFDEFGRLVVGGGSKEHTWYTDGTGQGLYLSAPDYNGHDSVLSLEGRAPYQGTVTIGTSGIAADVVYGLRVNVAWNVTLGDGYTAELTGCGGTTENQSIVSGSTVYTGDVVRLELESGHQFGMDFTTQGVALLEEEPGARLYSVNTQQTGRNVDVVFGDAAESDHTVTVTVTFTIRGQPATVRPTGGVSVSSTGGVLVDTGDGTWIGGVLTYTFPAAGPVYTVTASFAGYGKETVTNQFSGPGTIQMNVEAVPQKVVFKDGDEVLCTYSGWYVEDATSISDMYSGASGYEAWSDGSEILGNSDSLDISMFAGGELTLVALTAVADVGTDVSELHILVGEAQLAEGFSVNIDGFGDPEVFGDVDVGAQVSADILTLKSTGSPGKGEFHVALERPGELLILHVTVVGSVADADGRGSDNYQTIWKEDIE